VNIHLVKHDRLGLGYALLANPMMSDMHRWRVRFWQKIAHEIFFPSTCFMQGDLIDLGIIDDTEKLDLFS